MATNKRHFRTVFTARLVQLTSLNVGGTLGSSDCDAPLAIDGRNRYVLRGTSLAGALVATLRKLGYAVPESISGSAKGDYQSRWLVHNLHLEKPEEVHPELRQMVAIDPSTRGALDGALFDAETLPRGTAWKLFVEADVRDDADGREAERLLAAVLKHWSFAYGQIGAHNARGMGYFHLKNRCFYRVEIPCGQCLPWPDNSVEKPWDWFRSSDQKNECIVRTGFDGIGEPSSRGKPVQAAEITACIRVGKTHSGYGLDTLSIGGHHATHEEASVNSTFLAPEGMQESAWLKTETDMFPAVTRSKGKNSELEPFIPGSSLRGALRHSAERFALHDSMADTLKRLFGSLDKENKQAQDGALIIFDAYLDKNQNNSHAPYLALIQHHAEDEFTAGVYGSSKFDRIFLTAGRFPVRLIIESCPAEGRAQIKKYLECLLPVLRLAAIGHLDLGGACFRGAGWISWEDISLSIAEMGNSPSPRMNLTQLERWLKEAPDDTSTARE